MTLFYEIYLKFNFVIHTIYEMLIQNVFNLRQKCKSKARLDGKVVVITGGNTGIGKETALQLSLRGAKIIIACRDEKKGINAINEIKLKNPKANIDVMKLDLSSLSSVRKFAEKLAKKESRIDILINNAGVTGIESNTEDDFDMQFGTNHLGHFLLTLSILKLLKNSSNARIINVSSSLHLIGKIHFENINLRNNIYSPLKSYAQSKLANVLFTRELARRLGKKNNIKAYSLHPGVIRTELLRNMESKFSIIRAILYILKIDVFMGSQTTLYCALEESLENESGFYYDDCHRVDDKCMISRAKDDESAKKLWELSCDLVKLEDELKIY